ncbi:MAG: 50S ribosomal protein L19 [Candidatus Bipolaricaulota bacterium]
MEDLIRSVEEEFLSDDLPDITTGDLVRVHEKLGTDSGGRVQVFEGTVLKKSGSGAKKMITVRKISSGIGVEKTFPLHSPKIEKVELVRQNNVRQARPYYLRKKNK